MRKPARREEHAAKKAPPPQAETGTQLTPATTEAAQTEEAQDPTKEATKAEAEAAKQAEHDQVEAARTTGQDEADATKHDERDKGKQGSPPANGGEVHGKSNH